MRSSAFPVFLTVCSMVSGSSWNFFQPSETSQDRVFFDLEPKEIFAKWGPFGYFNEYLDPSNMMGPEILKGFGSPVMPYNGFNALETITTRPLEIPPEATSTAGYDPELFAPPASTEAPKTEETTISSTAAPSNSFLGNLASYFQTNNAVPSNGAQGPGNTGFNGHGGVYNHALPNSLYSPPMSPNAMYGFRSQAPQVMRGVYSGPASQFVGYHPLAPAPYPDAMTLDMNLKRMANH